MQRRLGLYLAICASGVLLFSALQAGQTPVLTIRQAWVNLGVAVVASLILVWPFPVLVEVFCGSLRFTAPIVAVFFLARGDWEYLPPLLLLGLVFHGCMWVAQEVGAGRGPIDMGHGLGAWLSQLRRQDAGSARTETRHRSGRSAPFEPDQPPPGGGTFIVRGPDEPANGEPGDSPREGGRSNPAPPRA